MSCVFYQIEFLGLNSIFIFSFIQNHKWDSRTVIMSLAAYNNCVVKALLCFAYRLEVSPLPSYPDNSQQRTVTIL